MRVILGFLVFLTILKTLRYSRVFYDVRLAQRAIQIALPGICHMALVVSVYFFVFMAFGYLVFGQHEWNYSDMIHATQTMFSYCVSAFENTEFFNNRVLGVLFLSSFMLVMICILINLFQAVILSAYEEMKQPVYEEPSEEAEAMTYLCAHTDGALQEGPMPRCPGDLPAAGPLGGRSDRTATRALQATPGMRVRGRSAEGVLRVPDSRAAWTFRLGLLGPAAAESRVLSRRALHRGRRSYPGFVARTECPTDGPTRVVLEAVSLNSSEPTESSVSCQVVNKKVCKLDRVRINRNDDKPVRLTRDMGDTFNATVILFCPIQEYYYRGWSIYSVPYVGAVPDWTKPLEKPPVKFSRGFFVVTIPPYSLPWGVYLFNFSVVVRTRDPQVPGKNDSDRIYVVIFRRPLNAVISGPSNITINFTDGVTLNGNMSSDPEETDPLEKERLKFLWYCTTDPDNH
ncbi:PREDICTED: polycystic kidney disease and receptor for egg jelly-related protein-like, partial [Bison bison bison]|uniref:Polycystic kidney disease and receptor for egg jelly-related protein-like n=1 Tax=Bison bison bison TaxID=43346 RepID=A0A6P3H9E0_BISBB